MAKVVSNVLLIVLCCSLKNAFTQFSQKNVWPPTNSFAHESRLRELVPSPMAPSPYHRTRSATGDCDHVFSDKSLKRFVGDNLYIVILDFSADILTLSVKIWCPSLVQENYGQLVLVVSTMRILFSVAVALSRCY